MALPVRFEEGVPLAIAVADKNRLRPIARQVAGIDAHSGAGLSIHTVGDATDHRLVREGAVPVVPVEGVRLLVVGHQKVRPGVSVDIGHGDAQRLAAGAVQASSSRYVREGAVPVIVIKYRSIARVILRGAHVRLAPRVPANLVGLGTPAEIAADEQVEIAVPVVVHPGTTRAEPSSPNPCL